MAANTERLCDLHGTNKFLDTLFFYKYNYACENEGKRYVSEYKQELCKIIPFIIEYLVKNNYKKIFTEQKNTDEILDIFNEYILDSISILEQGIQKNLYKDDKPIKILSADFMRIYLWLKSTNSDEKLEYSQMRDNEQIRKAYEKLLNLYINEKVERKFVDLEIDESISENTYKEIISSYNEIYKKDKDELQTKAFLHLLLKKYYNKYQEKNPTNKSSFDELCTLFNEEQSRYFTALLLEEEKQEIAKKAAKSAKRDKKSDSSAEKPVVQVIDVSAAAAAEAAVAEGEDIVKLKRNLSILLDAKLKRCNLTIKPSKLQSLVNVLSHFNFKHIPNMCNYPKCSGRTIYGFIYNMDKSTGITTFSNPWKFIHRECLEIGIDSIRSDIISLLSLIRNPGKTLTEITINHYTDAHGRLQFYINFKLNSNPGHISLHADGFINQSHIKYNDLEQQIKFVVNGDNDIIAIKTIPINPDYISEFDFILNLLNIILVIFSFTFKFGVVNIYDVYALKYLKYKYKYLELKKFLQKKSI